ncbi:Alpha-aminoadipic semialdehyde dehydrogenase [Nowakowskiella sp. JEL0078]|nr:Alpha-aminoadipic semialdehyde dehydrogenase [Nowakowskiella sp. JEL0078]
MLKTCNIFRFSSRCFSSKPDTQAALKALGISQRNFGAFDGTWHGSGTITNSVNPVDNQPIADVINASADDLLAMIPKAKKAHEEWRMIPAPKRGDIVRQIRNKIYELRIPLGTLISLEVGKILAEGIGEVQEYIDIADFAVGLSRCLNGQIIPSERPSHVLVENFHPLGVVGIISAFNFPHAVFGWNQTLAMITGNSTIWKPAPSTPLTAIATTKIIAGVLAENDLPGSLACLATGGSDIGKILVSDRNVNLISFTGSTKVGREVGIQVQQRFGKSLLELGGNNAIIVCDDADFELALPSVLFASVGTAGQRCTTTRRLFLHKKIYNTFLERLVNAYKQIKIGDPLESGVLCGPLHTKSSVAAFEQGVSDVILQGGKIIYGGHVLKDGNLSEGNFVQPTITSIHHDAEIVKNENFVPILHVIKFENFKEAVAMNNSVTQGLSSSVFTEDLTNIFNWIGPSGSDCGIVNVNVPTNGAEIGGAFGGEKETGGGREV